MKYDVFRVNYSPYMANDFAMKEKVALEELPSIKMNPQLPKNECILITNSSTVVNEIPIETLNCCKLLIHPNSGYDNFNAHFVEEANFPIILGNEIRAVGVAQYIMTSLLKHYGDIPNQSKWSQTRAWSRTNISNLKIQLIGQGHIGKILTESLSALGCSIENYDPYVSPDSKINFESDVFILTCSLNEKNKKFINKDFFNQFKNNILFINAARGNLVNEEDLLCFLEKNPHSFAFLDVFNQEPFIENKFAHVSNINLTSHIAGCSNDLDDRIINFEKQVISDFLSSNSFLERYSRANLKLRIKNNILV